jgi:hypothetical protein
VLALEVFDEHDEVIGVEHEAVEHMDEFAEEFVVDNIEL